LKTFQEYCLRLRLENICPLQNEELYSKQLLFLDWSGDKYLALDNPMNDSFVDQHIYLSHEGNPPNFH
jgi:hypothetical protein